MNDNINLFCRSIETCGGSYYCMEGVVMCFLHATVYRDANAYWLACHSISKSEIQLMDDLNDVVEKANSIVQMLYEYACKKLKNDPDMLSAIRRKIGKANNEDELLQQLGDCVWDSNTREVNWATVFYKGQEI